MTPSEPRWMQLLRRAAEKTSIREVAQLLGYSRTSISLALGGKYPGGTAKLEETVLTILDPSRQYACTYTGQTITADACRTQSTQRAPTHNPTLMGYWGACQRCQFKCKGDA